MVTTDIRARLSDVRERLARAAARAGRAPGSVRLIAVSKNFPPEYVRAAAAAGQMDFGENRVQEALEKISATADIPIRWHLVGHLQSNKARKAAQAFASVQSVDSAELLARLDTAAADAGRVLEVLIQVRQGDEPTKHGARVDQLRAIFDRAETCRAARVVGLMALPPFMEDPEDARPFFRQLRDVRDTLCDEGVPAEMLRELSMGMSHDFEIAIEEGATMVRIGTAVFGERGA